MALQAHPTILIDLTPDQVFDSDTVILHSSSSDTPTITFQYWITTRSILPTFTHYFQEAGYNVIYFTPFSTEAAWTRLYPDQPVTNTISAKLTMEYPIPIPYRYYLMSTSPTPENPPSRNYPSNAPANPTTALIARMHQTLQKNATLMVQLQKQTSPMVVQHTHIALT